MSLRLALCVCLVVLAPVLGAGAPERESVTFLLGEDEDPSRPMYRVAASFFAKDPQERTDHVITTARSLEEVRDYLDHHAPTNQLPWGLVNLVVHGSRWGQMDVPVAKGGTPVREEELSHRGALELAPLPSSLLDDHSEIRVHACGLGEDVDVLRGLSRLFRNREGQTPRVRGTRLYTCFQTGEGPGDAPKRFLVRNWQTTFRPGDRPTNAELLRRFRRLPQAPALDVEAALNRRVAHGAGDAFSVETPIQFQWTLVLGPGSEVPMLGGQRRLLAWLHGREEFRQRLMARSLSLDQLHWEARAITYRLNGQDYPALQVLGLGRVLHLLQWVEDEAAQWEADRAPAH